MGYPQATAMSNQPTAVQDSVTTVLGHTAGQLDEVEKRLTSLRDRIEVRSQLEKNPGQPPVSGMLNQALSLRNSASRLVDLCNVLESLL